MTRIKILTSSGIIIAQTVVETDFRQTVDEEYTVPVNDWLYWIRVNMGNSLQVVITDE